ncbi:hypothetical protein [Niabella hibiscisoli]|uniref:hypothetical protein n=1 Tax=Niabella hibiscisoli TaxID=1825928 RepID=UPI0021D4864A|nr:hypothetical protein [Niabella hibiscisoli]
MSEPVAAIFYNDQQPDKIFYQGLALQQLGEANEASQRFENLISYGRAHINDKVKMDFFAVSLPDLMIFDDDLNLRNILHCYYLMALGYLGLKDYELATLYFDKVLELDKTHSGAILHSEYARQAVLL